MAMQWEQGCSLKQDGGYESYLLKRSLAPFAYTMSYRAPAVCPLDGPKHSECRQWAPGSAQVPQETKLWQQTMTRGRTPAEHRPQTVLTGTSAYRGAGEAPVDDRAVAVEGGLRNSLWTGGYCRRALMERVPAMRPDYVSFTPAVEPVRAVDSRCNKAVYARNPSNCFMSAAPAPPPATYAAGRFQPGKMC